MSVNEKFAPIRKGLLEFLILRIIAADKVYAADMLKKLADTEFATQEGTLYPLLTDALGATHVTGQSISWRAD
jgi:PadR family transcriptional regulator PadR